ncbi:MAG TPA: hypothetical protein VL691_20340, partial [Vicinamibacteria bacterium]|nr:hypothetical protein [Vicinamibacteria bacterium]
RVAVVVSILTTGALLLVLGGTPVGAWLPSVAGVAFAGLVFAAAWIRPTRPRPDLAGPGASIGG